MKHIKSKSIHTIKKYCLSKSIKNSWKRTKLYLFQQPENSSPMLHAHLLEKLKGFNEYYAFSEDWLLLVKLNKHTKNT